MTAKATAEGALWAMVVALLLCCSASCRNTDSEIGRDPVAPVGSKDEVRLEDRTSALGVDVMYRNGEEAGHCGILESLGGGVGWFDYDRDGWLDLVAPRGGSLGPGEVVSGLPTALLRSLVGQAFVDVSASSGLQEPSLYSHGVAIGDYDNDGFCDLLITGYGPSQLWRNLGDGTFAAAEKWAGGLDPRWSSSAGWADFDNDGSLDLYVTRYVDWSFDNNPFCGTERDGRDICPPRDFNGLSDSVYRSNGDGTFTDVSQEVGLRSDGKGLGVLLLDADVDGDMDAYVCNDTVDNFLYVNDGQGVFTERGLLAGVALDDEGTPNGSMGVALLDVNRDRQPDIWVANYERESFALYRSQGKGQFLHVSRRYGIGALGGLFVGFGTCCGDFNGDGFVDIVVANGHVIKYPLASPRKQLPLLLCLEGDRFRRYEATAGSYFGTPHDGRGLAAGDFDNDGDLDLALSNLNAPVAVVENLFPVSQRHVLVELVGRRSNRDGIGAKVALLGGAGMEVISETQVVGGGSYLSHHDRRIHLTWPAELPIERGHMTVRVEWPSGEVDQGPLRSPADGGQIRIVEGMPPAADTGA